jgi:hypothetical protein
MMCSYIIGAESQGYEHFKGKIPSIFDIQENIEHAWDLGINAQGRIETGGIRGTRKYIGTPDVGREAIFSDFVEPQRTFWSSDSSNLGPNNVLLFRHSVSIVPLQNNISCAQQV